MKITKMSLNNLNSIRSVRRYVKSSFFNYTNINLITVPIIVCSVSPKSQNDLVKNITQETIKKADNNVANTPITNRTKTNLDALKKADVPERDRKKYIDSKGYMTEDGKDICKNKGVTSFKGAPPDEVIPDDHKIPMSELPENASYEELMNVDISLPPELQAIADMPIVSSDPDLMSDIMADLPEGFTPDEGLLAHLREVVGEMMGL